MRVQHAQAGTSVVSLSENDNAKKFPQNLNLQKEQVFFYPFHLQSSSGGPAAPKRTTRKTDDWPFRGLVCNFMREAYFVKIKCYN